MGRSGDAEGDDLLPAELPLRGVRDAATAGLQSDRLVRGPKPESQPIGRPPWPPGVVATVDLPTPVPPPLSRTAVDSLLAPGRSPSPIRGANTVR